MNILLEEVRPKAWMVRVQPVTAKEKATPLPGPVQLAGLLLDVAGDLLKQAQAEEAEETEGRLIQFPEGPILPPRG